MSDEKGTTSIGLERNVAGLLCYVLGRLTGLVFLILEKENKFIRFHAWQSIATFGALTVVIIILNFIPFIGWILGWLVSLLGLALWIILMIKAYQGQTYMLPWAGSFAEKKAGL